MAPVELSEFVSLTQELVDLAIEIIDITKGDPDLEPNGDENEDDDPSGDFEWPSL